jgi:hypothetical protein
VSSEKNMEAVEAARAKFRPERITTLFVGESAPSSGKFFYYGNTAMTRYMRSAVELARLWGRRFPGTLQSLRLVSR